MTTANRQEDGGKSGSPIIGLTENVAIITGQARIAYEKLTSKEWVAIVKKALAHAKPYLRYISAFLPLSKGDINCFSITRDNANRVDGVGLRMAKTVVGRSVGSYVPMPLAFFMDNGRAVQICEVKFSIEPEVSGKVILVDACEMAILKCTYGGAGDPWQGNSLMEDIIWFNSDEMWEKYFSTYAQIGPLTLLAVSYLLNETYQKKIEQIRNLGDAGKTVGAFLDWLDFGNGIVLEHPWGFEEGSKKQ